MTKMKKQQKVGVRHLILLDDEEELDDPNAPTQQISVGFGCPIITLQMSVHPNTFLSEYQTPLPHSLHVGWFCNHCTNEMKKISNWAIYHSRPLSHPNLDHSMIVTWLVLPVVTNSNQCGMTLYAVVFCALFSRSQKECYRHGTESLTNWIFSFWMMISMKMTRVCMYAGLVISITLINFCWWH